MLLTVNDHTIFVPPLCATCLTRTCKTAVRKHDHELTKTNVKCMWADPVSSNIHCYLTWPIHTLRWCSPSWLFTLYGVLFNCQIELSCGWHKWCIARSFHAK